MILITDSPGTTSSLPGHARAVSRNERRYSAEDAAAEQRNGDSGDGRYNGHARARRHARRFRDTSGVPGRKWSQSTPAALRYSADLRGSRDSSADACLRDHSASSTLDA